jgi:hypothetical protein
MKVYNWSSSMRLLLLPAFVVGALGCSSEVKLNEAPVSVSGKVLQSGRPLGGLVVTFQPLGDGHLRDFPVNKDGSFNGELVSGEYAYFVAKPIVPSAAQAVRKLSPKYFEADLSRTVTIEPGQQLAIALD